MRWPASLASRAALLALAVSHRFREAPHCRLIASMSWFAAAPKRRFCCGSALHPRSFPPLYICPMLPEHPQGSAVCPFCTLSTSSTQPRWKVLLSSHALPPPPPPAPLAHACEQSLARASPPPPPPPIYSKLTPSERPSCPAPHCHPPHKPLCAGPSTQSFSAGKLRQHACMALPRSRSQADEQRSEGRSAKRLLLCSEHVTKRLLSVVSV